MSLDAIKRRVGAQSRSGKPTPATPPASPAIPAVPPVAVGPYQPFPVEVLPPILRGFVLETASSVDCDPAYVALPALTVAGAAACAAVVVSPKRRFREPPAVWGCTVGDSGTGKSPGMAPVADLVFGIGKKLKESFKEQWKRYEQDTERWNGGNEGEDRPEKPAREFFTTVDVTIERLAEMVGVSPGGSSWSATSWPAGSGRSRGTRARVGRTGRTGCRCSTPGRSRSTAGRGSRGTSRLIGVSSR